MGVIPLIDRESIVYTKIKKEIEVLCTSSSTTYLDTPPEWPHLYLSQRDNPSTSEDLSNNENAVKPMYEITVYTKGTASYTNGKKIHALSDKAMREMGFHRTFGPQQVTNLSDTSITRIIARYSRVIGSNDTL